MEGDKVCDVCRNDNKIEAAAVFCCKCKTTLCNNCHKLHKRFSVMDEHKIILLDEYEETELIEFDESCKIHAGKDIEAYCLDHSELLCAVCLVKHHRKCENVNTIEEVVDTSLDGEPRRVIENSILTTEKEISVVIKEVEGNLENVCVDKNKAMEVMEKFIYDAKSSLDKHLQGFRNNLEKTYLSTEDELKNYLDLTKRFKTRINKWQTIMKEVQIRGSRHQMFVTFEKIRCQMIEEYAQIQPQLQDGKEFQLTLQFDKSLVADLLHEIEPEKILKVSNKSLNNAIEAIMEVDKVLTHLSSKTITGSNAVSLEDTYANSEDADVQGDPNLSDRSTVTLQKQSSIDSLANLSDEAPPNVDLLTASVNLDSVVDYNASFKGGTFLKNGHLLLADHSGRKVVQFDCKMKKIQVYDMDGKPTDIATAEIRNEVFVAINMIAIHEFRLESDSELVYVKRIRAPKGTWGIAVLGDNIIAGTHKAVELLQRDGTRIKKIPKQGIETFVCASPKHNTFYYKDGNMLICQNIGNNKAEYQCKFATEISGIALDYDGNVYISRRFSQTVSQIPRVGMTGRVLINHLETRAPYAIIFHPWDNTFVVTSSVVNDGFRVYRFVESCRKV